jgi:hypothetical protein
LEKDTFTRAAFSKFFHGLQYSVIPAPKRVTVPRDPMSYSQQALPLYGGLTSDVAVEGDAVAHAAPDRSTTPSLRRKGLLAVAAAALLLLGTAYLFEVCRANALHNIKRGRVAAFSGLSQSDDPMTPWMGIRDMARLYQLMSKAQHYREFGSGGSTVQAVGFPNILKIVSTESDGDWVLKIKSRSDTQMALTSGRLILEQGDIGPTGEWGYPQGKLNTTGWPAYSNMNNSLEVFNPPFWFDLVFVDGRFRVACLLKAVKAITPENINKTTLALHDYVPRNSYHVVEEFVERIDVPPESIEDRWAIKAFRDFFSFVPGDDVLGVFRKRSGVDEDKLDAAIRKYEYELD